MIKNMESVVRNHLLNKGNSYSPSLKNRPLVSIGICVKNSEARLKECLETIIGSNYEKSKLEIIVVDGESIDNTVNIVRDTLKSSGIDFKVLSDFGKGLSFARQLELEM